MNINRGKRGMALSLLALPLASQLLTSALAQNTVFTYQGRVQDNGNVFTGLGQFQFALVTSTNLNHTATATANLAAPFVTSYNVTFGGNGYVTPPAVTISGGGGTGATATANLTGGVVTSLAPGSAGTGYTSAPTGTIAPPPPATSYASYWSNDGTSMNGSEPAAAVSLGVTNGLFTVAVGDPTLPNMAPISATLFNQPGLQLQLWFNDGTHGFAALYPPQTLTPTPYAVVADSAVSANSADSVSGTIAAAQLSGTVPLAHLPAGLITNGAGGVSLAGNFSGNGAGVTNVSFNSLNANGDLVWGNFVPAASLAVGSAPGSVIPADVNGDGHVDLISANYAASTLTVLTNNGSGGFGFNATLAVSGNPYYVCAADVNGDGHVDLISANYLASTLSVLTNNGSGVFGFNATLTVGSGPVEVVAADVNGDGHVDLITANYLASTLTVWTNNGSGVFGSNATLNVGIGPEGLVAADVNADGAVDLISANYGANTLTVLTNNGGSLARTPRSRSAPTRTGSVWRM